MVTRLLAESVMQKWVGDGASGQSINCCELSNGSISDVDVNGAGDVGAGVGCKAVVESVMPEVE